MIPPTTTIATQTSWPAIEAMASRRISSASGRCGYRGPMTNSLKSTVARKAAKAGAKHTAHGTVSKLKRSPMRATTLLALGGALGALAGWMAARGAGASTAPV
jgi:hypothetical protein